MATHGRWVLILSGFAILALCGGVLGPVDHASAASNTPSEAADASAGQKGPKVGLWNWSGPKTGHEHWVHVPEDYSPSKPCPILVMVHGWGSSGKGAIASSCCTNAVKRGWIAIAPTYQHEGNNDSVQVADEVVDMMVRKILKAYRVDRSLVVSSGFSGGGIASIRCFTTRPDLFTHLVSHSSVFDGAASPLAKVKGPDRRPVLVVWGNDEFDLANGPKERDHFTRKGNPTIGYYAPDGKHQMYPNHMWSWIDALVATRDAGMLSAAVSAAERLRGPGSEPKVATALAPYQGLTAMKEKSVAEGGDPFLKEWDGKHNAAVKAADEKAAKAAELYTKAVDEGRRQLTEMAEKFTPEMKTANLRWARSFVTRWAAAGDLCRETAEAYEKAYGERLPTPGGPDEGRRK